MKHIKISALLISFALFGAFFAGCQKEGVTLRMHIAGFGSDGKVYIDNSTPRWMDGDSVNINGADYTLSNNAVSMLTSVGNYKAVYPSSLVKPSGLSSSGIFSLSIPQHQRYRTTSSGRQIVEAPMAANSNAALSGPTSLWFKNVGALLAITVDNTQSGGVNHGALVVDRITVTSNGAPLWGDATLAITDVTTDGGSYNPALTIDPGQSANTSIVLAGPNGSNSSMGVSVPSNGSHLFYLYVPATPSGYSNAFTIEVEAHNAAGDGVYTRSQSTLGSGNIGCNQKASIHFKLCEASQVWNPALVGIIRGGEFKVSANGQKVYFAQGNLQYRASTNTWRLAEQQYNIVGSGSSNGTVPNSDNRLIGSSYDGWIDLFGWGTSGYGVASSYYPWLSTTNVANYPSLASGDYSGSDYDWGKNTVYVGDDPTAIFQGRTLTYNEWYYLLVTRKVSGNNSWQWVQLNYGSGNIQGLLVYHDNYDGTFYTRSTIITAIPDGCLFLPAVGIRNGVTLSQIGMEINYWAVTVDNRFRRPGRVNMGSATQMPSLGYFQYYNRGLAVRLVVDKSSK